MSSRPTKAIKATRRSFIVYERMEHTKKLHNVASENVKIRMNKETEPQNNYVKRRRIACQCHENCFEQLSHISWRRKELQRMGIEPRNERQTCGKE